MKSHRRRGSGLSDPERAALRRLAVFVGHFALNAAPDVYRQVGS
jgi:hypothetical protein